MAGVPGLLLGHGLAVRGMTDDLEQLETVLNAEEASWPAT